MDATKQERILKPYGCLKAIQFHENEYIETMLEVYKITLLDSGEIWWVSRNRRCWKVFKRYTTSCECSTYKFGLYS